MFSDQWTSVGSAGRGQLERDDLRQIFDFGHWEDVQIQIYQIGRAFNPSRIRRACGRAPETENLHRPLDTAGFVENRHVGILGVSQAYPQGLPFLKLLGS